MRYLPILLVLLLAPTQAHAFFFLAAIPVAVQIGLAAAMAAATIATTTMSIMSARKQAKYEEATAELNAKLEGTAALQRDTIRREELERTVGAIRAARGGKGLYSPTATSFLSEANEIISSDRTIELVSSRQRQSNYLAEARAARARGRASLVSGAVQGGMSLFQLGMNFTGSSGGASFRSGFGTPVGYGNPASFRPGGAFPRGY